MQQAIEPTEISFDAYTMCSFLPNLDSARALPARAHRLPAERRSVVRMARSEGRRRSRRLTDDPYYAKVLRDPHAYFKKKLAKYVEETGCVKRGIEMLIDCHQNHLGLHAAYGVAGATVPPPVASGVGRGVLGDSAALTRAAVDDANRHRDRRTGSVASRASIVSVTSSASSIASSSA